ncbi:MAG: aminotransferase class IV [Clostridia bacterium]|nr:aminotransferase class IV [Clostridia bacterium]
MQTLGYYDGHYDEIDRMTIPMNDRVHWFGDGVYDAGPARHYQIFALDEHVDRFYRSADKLDIRMPMEKEDLKALLREMVCKLDADSQFVYYQVTRGAGPRTHTFSEGPAKLWIMLTPQTMADGRTPIQLITAEDTRFFHCDIKTLNLIPSVMASERAKQAGCGECVLYRPGGRVTECAHSNVSILQDGALYTAPTDNLILPGITRAHLIRACETLGIPVHEEAFSLDALYAADEILVTSSSKLCVRADRIDGKTAGGRDPETFEKIRRFMLDEFLEMTEPWGKTI